LPNEEPGLESRKQIIAEIESALGGRAAEDVIFGRDEITQGASSDIQRVTYLARQMVTKLGMSELGQFALEEDGGQVFLHNDWTNQRPEYSEKIASLIDQQIRNIVFAAYERVKQMVREHRDLLDRLVERLIEEETIDGEEFRRLVAKETQTPIDLKKTADVV
jgi:cell division protease FtsH